MSNPNTNSVFSSFLSNQTKRQGNEQSNRWLTGAAAAALGYAVRDTPPTPQSTTSPSPHAQSHKHEPHTKAQSKHSQDWAIHGDLEPSGCTPWFS